jgi:hypothetical protein
VRYNIGCNFSKKPKVLSRPPRFQNECSRLAPPKLCFHRCHLFPCQTKARQFQKWQRSEALHLVHRQEPSLRSAELEQERKLTSSGFAIRPAAQHRLAIVSRDMHFDAVHDLERIDW